MRQDAVKCDRTRREQKSKYPNIQIPNERQSSVSQGRVVIQKETSGCQVDIVMMD